MYMVFYCFLTYMLLFTVCVCVYKIKNNMQIVFKYINIINIYYPKPFKFK